jgi:uncharacterized protein (TIGR02145 family)
VTIGSQVWAKKNLNCDVEGSKCYDDDLANCAEYGRLYDWATAMALPSSCNSSICSDQIQAKHRGICPSGWHIPSNAEWTTLTDYVGSDAGTKLKAASGWDDSYNGASGNGTDEFGFSALPGGHGNSYGSFYFVGSLGYWLSATEGIASTAASRNMRNTFSNVSGGGNGGSNKSDLYSVRCVRD